MGKAQQPSIARWYLLALLMVAGGVNRGIAQGAGALSTGESGAAAARGGTMLAAQGSALEAMEGNPAELVGLGREVELGAVGVLATGNFASRVDADGKLVTGSGAVPYVAVAVPVGQRWTLAGAVTPESLMRVDWRYIDPPGTAGASYGEQRNKSAIVAVRTAGGVGWQMGSRWSAGATLGLVYNANTLISPYIFQEQPQLTGLKVLLNLHTAGWGWNGGAGAAWQPSSRVRVGAAWKSGTSIDSRGRVSGTASAQFAALGVAADPVFQYRALVETHLPQTAGVGIEWVGPRHVALSLDGGWSGWGGAFHRLPVKLTDGTNATINSIVGSTSLNDAVALDWRDQYAVRAGVELPVRERWTLRGGYGYQTDPVPSSTLTPLTAAILRNSLTAGAGWRGRRWGWDVAYGAQLPATESVGLSRLKAGEYDFTGVRVAVQSVTATTRCAF